MQSFTRIFAAACVAVLPSMASAVVIDFDDVVYPTPGDPSDDFIEFLTVPYTEDGFTVRVLANHYDFINLNPLNPDTAIQLDSLALDRSDFNALSAFEITSAAGAFSLESLIVATSFREADGSDFSDLLDPNIFRLEADRTGGGTEVGSLSGSLRSFETFDDSFNDITALRLVQEIPGQLRISEFTFGDPITDGGSGGGMDMGNGDDMNGGGGMAGGGMDGGDGMPGGGMTGGGMSGGGTGGDTPMPAPVPLPASVLFMLAGLGGLGLLRTHRA